MPPAAAMAYWAELIRPTVVQASSGMSLFVLFPSSLVLLESLVCMEPERFWFNIFPDFPDAWQPVWSLFCIIYPTGLPHIWKIWMLLKQCKFLCGKSLVHQGIV